MLCGTQVNRGTPRWYPSSKITAPDRWVYKHRKWFTHAMLLWRRCSPAHWLRDTEVRQLDVLRRPLRRRRMTRSQTSPGECGLRASGPLQKISKSADPECDLATAYDRQAGLPVGNELLPSDSKYNGRAEGRRLPISNLRSTPGESFVARSSRRLKEPSLSIRNTRKTTQPVPTIP